MHFPKLRVLWSSSPHVTAEIFEDLKVKKKMRTKSFLFSSKFFQRDREEPDTKRAMLVTAESDLLDDEERYNSLAQVKINFDVFVCLIENVFLFRTF